MIKTKAAPESPGEPPWGPGRAVYNLDLGIGGPSAPESLRRKNGTRNVTGEPRRAAPGPRPGRLQSRKGGPNAPESLGRLLAEGKAEKEDLEMLHKGLAKVFTRR